MILNITLMFITFFLPFMLLSLMIFMSSLADPKSQATIAMILLLLFIQQSAISQ